jgi:hypothetical protein
VILVRKNKRGEGVLCRKLKVVTRQRSKESGTLNVLKQHFFIFYTMRPYYKGSESKASY